MVNRNSRRPRHSYPLLFSFPLFLFTLVLSSRLARSVAANFSSFLSIVYVRCSVLYSLCKILLDLFFPPFSSDSIVPLIPSTSFSLSFLVFRPSVYPDAPPLCWILHVPSRTRFFFLSLYLLSFGQTFCPALRSSFRFSIPVLALIFPPSISLARSHASVFCRTVFLAASLWFSCLFPPRPFDIVGPYHSVLPILHISRVPLYIPSHRCSTPRKYSLLLSIFSSFLRFFLWILTVFLPFVLRSSSTHKRDKISSVGVVARLEALSIRTPMRREERNGRYNSPPLFPRRTSLCRIVYLLSPELAPPLTPNLDALPPMSKREEAPTCIYRFTFTSCVRIVVYDIECSTTLYSFPKHASATHGHIFK